MPLTEAERTAAVYRIVVDESVQHPWSLLSGVLRAYQEYFADFHGVPSYVWFNPDDFVLEDRAVREAVLHESGPLGLLALWKREMGVYSLVNAVVMGALGVALVLALPLVVRALWRGRREPHVAMLAATAIGIVASVPFNPPWDIDAMQVQATTVPFTAALFAVTLFGRRAEPEPSFDPSPRDSALLGWLGPAIVLSYAAMIAAVSMAHVRVPALAASVDSTCASPDRSSFVAHFDRSALVHVVADGAPDGIGVSLFTTDLAYLEKRNGDLVHSIARANHPGGAIALVYDANAKDARILVDDTGALARWSAAWGLVCGERLAEDGVVRVVHVDPVPP
jgi:hypothetical protein